MQASTKQSARSSNNETSKSNHGNTFKGIDDFKHVESWMHSTEKETNMRIGLAWSVKNKPSTIRDSGQNREINIMFFRTGIKSLFM